MYGNIYVKETLLVIGFIEEMKTCSGKTHESQTLFPFPLISNNRSIRLSPDNWKPCVSKFLDIRMQDILQNKERDIRLLSIAFLFLKIARDFNADLGFQTSAVMASQDASEAYSTVFTVQKLQRCNFFKQKLF